MLSKQSFQHVRHFTFQNRSAVLAATLVATLVGLLGAPLCPESFDTSVMSVTTESLNDTTAFDGRCQEVQPENGWRYAIDGDLDGIGQGDLSAGAEVYGLATMETPSDIFIAISGAFAPPGSTASQELGLNPTWGDLFINFSSLPFAEASAQGQLFAIKFAHANNSGASTLGVYRDVSAKSVSEANGGFASYEAYNQAVLRAGGNPRYGPNCTNTSIDVNYFGPSFSLNVVSDGRYAGPIVPLPLPELSALGLDSNRFPNGSTIVSQRVDDSWVLV